MNSTNNYVEAQFLVIQDSILRHQRQFNVNMFLDKLFSEFEEYFKIKLLSLADGTFDGVYSKCFMGFSKLPEKVLIGGKGEGGDVFWVKIGQKFDYIICEFALFNNILWCPKICANEAKSGQN